MSLYPILWAVEHAPVVDAEERAILVALVSKGDFDGCNCYRAYATLAKAARVDKRTAMRKVQAMTARGLIREQPGPKPKAWLKLPKDKRPVVREVMVPASFWSAVQLEEINGQREERGRTPITPESRPDLPEAPPKKSRADKGRPNPRRSRKKTSSTPDRGVSESPRFEEEAPPSGVSVSHPAGCLEVTPRGVSESPNPPIGPSDSPSSPPAPPAPGERPASGGGRSGREEEEEDGFAKETTGGAVPSAGALHGALALVDDAVARWGSAHRAPGARDRLRLAERVAAELAAGGDEGVILDELTRDLGTAHSAVRVVLGARTATPGWGRRTDPRPDHARHEPSGPRPAWCGRCDERTRQLVVRAADGSERMARCDRCHPQADPAAEWGAAADESQEEAAAAEVDPIELERMRASLNGTPPPRGDDGQDDDGLSPAARAAAEEVRRRLAALRTA